MDIRALKKRREVLKHQPPKIYTKEENDRGEQLLKKATEAQQERRVNTYKDVYNKTYEAAGDLINMNRGRIFTCGGFGDGYRLGTGKWKYINKKWKKQ